MHAPSIVSTPKRVLADAGLFYAAAIWGATFFLVKDALTGIDPVTMVAYRFLLAGVSLLIFLIATGRPIFRGLGRAAFLSVILWLLYIPQTVGLGYTTASNSGFITGLFVAFIPLFLKTIFKRTPTLMEVIASAVALIGLWILTGGLRYLNIGDSLTLVAAMTYALHVLYSDKYMKAGIDPYMISCQQFLLVGLLSLLTALVLDLPLDIRTSSAAWTVVFLAFFPTLSAFVIQMLAQKITSPLKVSLIFAFEPVFAALFAWTLGDEPFVLRRAGGGILIFAALILSGLPTPGRKRS
jgi:drug/metabolite transporter (DMT)-like permease